MPRTSHSGVTRSAFSSRPKLPADFKRLPYVKPDAPRQGELRLADEGTYDSFNPLADKGNPAAGVGIVFDTL